MAFFFLSALNIVKVVRIRYCIILIYRKLFVSISWQRGYRYIRMGSNSCKNNVVWHHATVTRAMREELSGHKGAVIWLTGLSGAGKSTVAHAVEERLHQLGCRSFVFDGDNVRHGLCADLSFSEKDRHENLRRIGEMSKLFLEAGMIGLAAFISPYRADRNRVRSMVPNGDFFEVYCKCPLEICEARDVKGLYARARAGEIANYTGISSPYEEPEQPDLILDTGSDTLEECVDQVIQMLVCRSVVPKS